MEYEEVSTDREFLARLETGAEWRSEIEGLAAETGVEAGWFSALGAVQDAEIWFYDQDEKSYEPVEFSEPLEMAACLGNISMLDGERFAHTHVVLSRPSGQAIAGHLERATVFAGELHLKELDTSLEREHDAATELDLWL